MGMYELIGRLRNLLHEHRVRPDKIKITIEFLDPKDQSVAEFALKSKLHTSLIYDYRMIEGICSGKEFTAMGIKMQVKGFEYATQLACGCMACREGPVRRDYNI